MNILNTLRINGFNGDIDYINRKLKNNFKVADKYKAKYIIIIGDDEEKSNILKLKNNETKEEIKVKLDNLIDYLDENIEGEL